jgi:hypothetical protein
MKHRFTVNAGYMQVTTSSELHAIIGSRNSSSLSSLDLLALLLLLSPFPLPTALTFPYKSELILMMLKIGGTILL